MIKFGRHQGKLYSEVIATDMEYCRWVVMQKSSTNVGLLEFQQYLKEANAIPCPIGQCNCSKLASYYAAYPPFMDLINSTNIVTTKCGDAADTASALIPPEFPIENASVRGVFIDYLIRYMISCATKQAFRDSRCEQVLSGVYGTCNITNARLSARLSVKYAGIWSGVGNLGAGTMGSHSQEVYWRCIMRRISDSYSELQLFSDDDISMNAVLNVALCHFIAFGEDIAHDYFDALRHQNSIKFTNLQKYIVALLGDTEPRHILCNPTLGSLELQIGADADLIIGQHLIDVKCSKHDRGENIVDFVQLFLYAALHYYNNKVKCTKLTILNPVLNVTHSISLENWDNYEAIIELLRARTLIK
jgi:hypothetical protein